jgi:hypothetical protein
MCGGCRLLSKGEMRAMLALRGAKGPRLKPLLSWLLFHGLKGHGFYRRLALRGLMCGLYGRRV